MRLLVLVLLVAACKVLPPPPVLAPHAPAAAEDKGSTTAMVVLGTAGELLGGTGWGVALRIEHQQTSHTALGVELTGGFGEKGRYESGELFRHWLIGVRGYGRYAPDRDGPLATILGAGISVMRTGLVTGTVQAGALVSHGNADAIPIGAVSLALAVPLRAGRAYGAPPLNVALGPPVPGLRRPREAKTTDLPKTEVYLGFDLGVMGSFGSSRNRLSADLGIAKALRADELLFSLSVGDTQRFGP